MNETDGVGRFFQQQPFLGQGVRYLRITCNDNLDFAEASLKRSDRLRKAKPSLIQKADPVGQ